MLRRMATHSLRLRYRPIRIGWCVRDGNFEDLRGVIRLTHTLWGGRYNPIVPVGEPKRAEELIELYRVDALHPAVDEPSLTTFVQRFPYLRWPVWDKGFFIGASGGRTLATFLDIYHPVRRIFDEYIRNRSAPAVTGMIVEWDPADPLADALLVQFGTYPPKEETGKDYSQFVERYLRAGRSKLAIDEPLRPEMLNAITPSEISAFELRRDRRPNWDYSGLYVGDSSDFEDIVNFWNLRAADLELIFFDTRQEPRLKAITDAHLAALREEIEGPEDFEDYIGIWAKDGAEINLARFGQGILHARVGEGLWNGLNLKPPMMYIADHSALGSRSDSGPTPSITFELRPKPVFSEPEFDLHTQNMAVIVRPLVYMEEGQTTFSYPFLPELNEFYRRNAHAGLTEVRAQADGLAVMTRVTTSSLTIRGVSRRELVSKIFELYGMKAEASEAGRIAARLIQQMGGVQGCRAFKIAGVRKLIEKYSPSQPFGRSDAVQTIGENDSITGLPNFGKYEQLYIEYREAGKLTPHQVFDFLLKRGVFRVGLYFSCPNCELSFWMHLDDVATEVTCEYCGEQFSVTAQLKDRDWAYRRSGLFGRDDHQQGAIPVALTLQQLDTVLSTDMTYVTSMMIEPNEAQIEPCETDFIVVSQKNYREGIDLAIGECKANGDITEDDVRKMTKLANAFPCKRIQSYILFAKTAPFSPAEIDRCRRAQHPRRRRVILLSDRELEPYFVYERAKEEFAINPTAISLEDLANTTHDIYFDPKPTKKAE